MLGARFSLRSVRPVRIWRGLSTTEAASRRKSQSRVVKRGRSFPRQATSKKNADATIATGRTVAVRDDMTIAELARRMGKSSDSLIQASMQLNHEAVLASDRISSKIASSILRHFQMKPSATVLSSKLEWHPRPPVITVMGHVDHGKTTLLDRLRQTSVAAQEPGGITQHIGAFRVQLFGGAKVTFIDTPGHALFSSLRQRGANVTDIVVLVVAADDGVMNQTTQSIEYAQNAGVPIVVAINKCDKGNANMLRAKEQLLQRGIQLEEMGGDIQAVEVSALKGTNVDKLIEAILAEAELLNLQSHTNGPAEAVILESYLDRHRGPVATALVQHGEISVGSVLSSGSAWARVRQMSSDAGKDVSHALPSMPVRISGWRTLPAAGEIVFAVQSEDEARDLADISTNSCQGSQIVTGGVTVPLSDSLKPSLALVIKGDTQGSLEALIQSLKTYSQQEVALKVTLTGLGNINDSDVEMAASSDGIVVGFNVKLPKSVSTSVKKRQVPVVTHNVIYHLLGLIKDQLDSRVPPTYEEVVTGEAAILHVFQLRGKQKGLAAGCRVKSGCILRSKTHKFRIIRQKAVIYDGNVSSMKHFKEDVTEVKKETECGITFIDNPDFEEGDIVQCYTSEKVQNRVTWNLDLREKSPFS